VDYGKLIIPKPQKAGRTGDRTVKEMEVRIEQLNSMRAAYIHSASNTPEEETIAKMFEWAKTKGLDQKEGMRLFGRNTYPDERPEPRGYELYLTLDEKTPCDGPNVPGGLYAVLRFKNLSNIGFAWKKLWDWLEQSDHEHAGWQKSAHDWVGGFEEQVNWQKPLPQTEWVFDLWVPLKK
jgi:DNA gyrase inhibitor GyrI